MALLISFVLGILVYINPRDPTPWHTEFREFNSLVRKEAPLSPMFPSHVQHHKLLPLKGNITAFLGLVSPMPTFWSIMKRGSTGSFSSQPYVFSLMSALFWTYYGILKHGGIFVVTTNAISCTFQIFYLSMYLWFATLAQRKETLSILLVILVSYTGVIAGTLFLEHGNQPIVTVGVLCIVTSVFSTAAPLTIIHKVVKTRSVEFMPLALSLGLFLNGTCWLAYSLSIKDMFLMIPNAIGVFLSAIQLLLYTTYRISGKRPENQEDKASVHTLETKEKNCASLKDVEAMASVVSNELPPSKDVELTIVTSI